MRRAAIVLGLTAVACAHDAGEASVLQASDLQSVDASFSPDVIVTVPPFEDAAALSASKIQAFLAHTPYGTASFLAAYTSHGQSAASAIATAAQSFGLNPLVFLVRAQVDQGLVGLAAYPATAARVEYAFGCGCEAAGQCDPGYAGFDVQLGCLGAALRQSLDDVAADGKTAGGWGPGIASTTLDAVHVVPVDASTSALYQYTPVVASGRAGGNWLVWNLWHKYASAVGYSGPMTGAAWIGDACAASGACDYGQTTGTCATQFPGGLCTLACTDACPSAAGEPATFCADFGSQGGFCLPQCDPNAPACRSGYSCKSVKQVGDTTASAYVCFP